MHRRPLDARERAAWFDTEGNLYVTPPSVPLKKSVAIYCISQFDQAPLEDFKNGALADGVRCQLLRGFRGKSKECLAKIADLESIAREIGLELPFIRTARKLAQVKRFQEFILRPRVQTRKSVEAARKLLCSQLDGCSTSRRPMEASERAIWFEAEGYLYVPSPNVSRKWGPVELRVSQFERKPLDDFAEGARHDGIDCRLGYRWRTKPGEYYVRIRRIDEVAKELVLESPYIRTVKRLEQIQSFKEYLARPRTRVTKSLGVARELLLGGPVV